MKFYKYNQLGNYFNIIFYYKLNAIYSYQSGTVVFFKNGKTHNNKNSAIINPNNYKAFWLNDKCYGTEKDFTKESWRRFVKLQVFL
jgi:hypothetical protein